MTNTKGFYTLKQIAIALNMTPLGAKKALVKKGVSMIKEDRKWYVDPTEFHRIPKFSNIKVDKLETQPPNQPLVTVNPVKGDVAETLSKENNHLKEIISLKDQQISQLKQDKVDQKAETRQWQEQAQKLLLLPPADNKQKATPMLLVAVSLGFLVVIALLITLFFIR